MIFCRLHHRRQSWNYSIVMLVKELSSWLLAAMIERCTREIKSQHGNAFDVEMSPFSSPSPRNNNNNVPSDDNRAVPIGLVIWVTTKNEESKNWYRSKRRGKLRSVESLIEEFLVFLLVCEFIQMQRNVRRYRVTQFRSFCTQFCCSSVSRRLLSTKAQISTFIDVKSKLNFRICWNRRSR